MRPVASNDRPSWHWPLFVFVIGMFLVVRGFEETWLHELRFSLSREPLSALLLALVGANVGPTLTTYGSLATMLWLTLIRKRGVYVSTTMYMRVALFTTPIVLITSLAL